jgi:hypothetical protein
MNISYTSVLTPGAILSICNGFRNKSHVQLISQHSFRATDIYSRTPLIRTLVIRTANYPDRLGPSGKFVHNSKELASLEITGYGIKYSTVLRLLDLQVRRGRKV